MDPNEFKRRLTELSVWEIPKVPNGKGRPSDPNALNKRRTKYVSAITVMEDDQDDEQDQEPIASSETNQTLGPVVKAVRVRPTVCDDCGRKCSKGRQTEAKVYESNEKRHWRETCLTCNKARNPYTNKFDVPAAASSLVWQAFHKGYNQPDFAKSLARKKQSK